MDEAEVRAHINEVFSPEGAQEWLKSRPLIFGGKTPEEVLQEPGGLKWISQVLAKIEYGGAA